MKNKPYPYYEVPEINDLKHLVDYCAEYYNDKIAFRYLKNNQEVSITYKSFRDDVAAFATYLVEKGYNRSHIGIIGENSYEWIVAFFAVVNSGNVAVPFDKESPITDLKHIYEKSDTTIIIHSDNYSEEAVATGCDVLINMNDLRSIIDDKKGCPTYKLDNYNSVIINNKDICAIVYTSGTTSEPKGVMLSHYNFAFDTVCTSRNLLFPDSTVLILPLHHTFGIVASITMPMIKGASIFINSSMKNLLNDINYAKPKFISCVPLVAEMFYKIVQGRIKSLGKEEEMKKLLDISENLREMGFDVRRILFKDIIDALGGNLELLPVGGAPINKNCVSFFEQIGIKIVTGYGISECSPVVSTLRNEHYEPASVGSVHPGVDVRIVNNEIQVRGPIVFSGYYKNEVDTLNAFDGEWFKTGDIGKIEDGILYITGRIKNLIILANGKNVSAEELEEKLLENIPQITEVIVCERNKMITAEIFIKDADDKTKADVESMIFEYNKNLPAFKHIGNVIFRDNEFPKTPTKKIKRISGGTNNA